MQRRRLGGGVGTRGWGGGGAAVCSRVRPSGDPCVRRSPRPPRSRSLRPAPGALRLQSRRAPVAAAARPPATLPLPLNSCAKYAALHLRGKPRCPLQPPGEWRARPASLRAPRRCLLHAAGNLGASRAAVRPATLGGPQRRGSKLTRPPSRLLLTKAVGVESARGVLGSLKFWYGMLEGNCHQGTDG